MSQVKEIPGWMLELSHQLNSQSSRSTSHPFWQVRCKNNICAPEGYSGKFKIIKYDEDCCVLYRSDKNSTEDLFNAIDLEFKIQYSINHDYWEGSDRAEYGEEQLFENLVIEFFDLTFDPAEDDLSRLIEWLKSITEGQS